MLRLSRNGFRLLEDSDHSGMLALNSFLSGKGDSQTGLGDGLLSFSAFGLGDSDASVCMPLNSVLELQKFAPVG